MMASAHAQEATTRLAARSKVVTEADLQADLASLLLSGDLSLETDQVVKREAQLGDGTRRRIDVEVGQAVFEVKKDLRTASVLSDGEVQLAGYLQQREKDFGTRVAGILTDGTSWRLYRLVRATAELQPEPVDEPQLSPTEPGTPSSRRPSRSSQRQNASVNCSAPSRRLTDSTARS